MNRYTIPKHPTREQWLKDRWATLAGEKRITASSSAVVHGAHKFVSVADYAIELLAPEPPTGGESNDAMVRGTNMQPVLAKWAGEIKGVTIVEPDVLYCFDEPGVRLLATLDGVDENGAVYEIKTYRGYFDGTLPAHWYWQGVQQAICADVACIEWIIFDSTLEIQFHTQHISSDEKQVHIDACRKFLGYIDAGMTPPDAVFTFDHIKNRYPEGDSEKTVELPETVINTFERLALAKSQQKEGKAVEDACKAELTELMGDAGFATIGGNVVATWRTSHPVKFDSKAFKEAHPALYEKFQVTTTQRTFLSKIKGDTQ